MPKKSWWLPIWGSSLILLSSCLDVFDAPTKLRETVDDPGADFTTATGLPWPTNAEIIALDDTHGGFHGDGEFYLVFQTDAETIQSYLDTTPSLDVPWQQGPIPTDIGFHMTFGTEGIGTMSVNGSAAEYVGDSTLTELFTSETVYFSATERCCSEQGEALRWHNGTFVLVDPTTNTVWFSAWDF